MNERRQHTDRMHKCRCGNVARLGETRCGACIAEDDEAQACNQLLQKAYNAASVDDLREVVIGLAERVLR